MTNWELQYQTGVTPWDKGEAAPPWFEFVAKGLPKVWEEGEILVPGCGAGHDVRAIAAQGFHPRGVDISKTAISLAEQFPKIGQEIYEVADVLDPGWHFGKTYAGWWEHTCFCAIPPSCRKDYVRSAGRLLKPSGVFAGVFYLTPNDPGEEDQGPPFNASIDEIEGLFAPYFEKIDSWVPQKTYPGREGREWIAIFRKKC